MKAVGIIPSRMNSTRFPGKALADLCGIPMVVRVWNAAVKSGALDEVFIATDSPEIISVCRGRRIPYLVTSGRHENPTSRTAEAASMVAADYYVMIGGDEPLLHPDDIRMVVTKGIRRMSGETSPNPAHQNHPFVVNAMAVIPSMEEALDPSNIKVVCDSNGSGISAFRTLSPPSGEDFRKLSAVSAYRKFVSIGIYTRKALDFFTASAPGPLECREHFDLLRFMEHQKEVSFIEIRHRTLSVDNPSDLTEAGRILSQTETYTGEE